jgi:hypothetical protein
VTVTQDGAIDAKWEPPAETGGSSIVSYSVQLWNKGVKVDDPKLPTTTATSFDTKGDTSSQFTVTVQAVNAAGLVSLVSDPSESIVAKRTATATTTTTAAPSPNNGNSGGGGVTTTVAPTPSRGSDTTSTIAPKSNPGATTTTTSPSSGTGNNAATNTTIPAATNEDQLTRVVSPVFAAPAISYSKNVYIATKTTTKTLLSLSRLSVPKGSKTTYALSSTSKKYCSLKGTVVTAVKAGTCSITVTVKQKTGKKTSKVVKLVVKKRS